LATRLQSLLYFLSHHRQLPATAVTYTTKANHPDCHHLQNSVHAGSVPSWSGSSSAAGFVQVQYTAVIESATKALAADDILKGCHYGIHLLLHVTTAESLVGKGQKQAISVVMLATSQAFFVTPLNVA
jgi:hypothetical protein